ncbi:hypothetical protein QE152_g30153 [Popillia japonica]|uniref:Uncharacterized protein n=1 Tax=Popillia japonica TaxID=7064 RepID=A0AAW1JFJ9_POPJA
MTRPLQNGREKTMTGSYQSPCFLRQFPQVWRELSEEVIENGFRKAGIYPFSDAVVSMDKLESGGLKMTLIKHPHPLKIEIQISGSSDSIIIDYVKQTSINTDQKRRKICADIVQKIIEKKVQEMAKLSQRRKQNTKEKRTFLQENSDISKDDQYSFAEEW